MRSCSKYGAALLLALFTISAAPLRAAVYRSAKVTPIGMVRVPGGFYRPFYKVKGADSVKIEPFYMDVTPVTNREFLDFVKANPAWSRSRIPTALAEHGYLKQWKSDYAIGDARLENVPVVNISWFAATAYATWVHKRLATVNEWEYASLASIVRPTRSTGLAKRELILAWYAKPNAALTAAGSVTENAYGICDLFGQVWEWTEDFNSVIIPHDTRGELNPSSTCGAGAIGSIDPTDYATFMRFAMRNSLQASYTIENVGFRCVKNIDSHETDKNTTRR
jgi:formylglycine-generating enzyme